MKSYSFKMIASALFALSLILNMACSNDFLHVQQKIDVESVDTLFMVDTDPATILNIDLPQAGNSKWRVLQYPTGVKVESLDGTFTDGRCSIRLTVPFRYELGNNYGLMLFPFVLDVEGIGLVRYPLFILHCGDPRLVWTGNYADFGYGSEGSFPFQSSGGLLIWEVVDKPAWITLPKQNGILDAGETEHLQMTVTRGNLPDGTYDGVIRIASNSAEKYFDLRVQMKVFDVTLSGKVTPLEGQVADADYCISNGLMVLAMTNPNRLCFYRPGQPVSTMPLSKIPTALTISESGDQIACTFTNTDLSLINPVNMTITKDIQLGVIPSDVALGNNGWAYVAPKDYPMDCFRSVNLNTDQIVKLDSKYWGMYSLKKMPGKNLLFASENGYNFMVFDISAGAAAPLVDEWAFTPKHYWLSEDGSQFFCEYRNIYKTPDYSGRGLITQSPPLLGTLAPVDNTIHSVVHSSALKQVFAAYTAFFPNVDKIYRYDDASYAGKGSITVNQCKLIIGNNLGTYRTELPWMFVDKNGSELILIKKGLATNSDAVYWFYEKVPL